MLRSHRNARAQVVSPKAHMVGKRDSSQWTPNEIACMDTDMNVYIYMIIYAYILKENKHHDKWSATDSSLLEL